MASVYLPCVLSSTNSPALSIAVSTLSAFCANRSFGLSSSPMRCPFPSYFAGETLPVGRRGQFLEGIPSAELAPEPRLHSEHSGPEPPDGLDRRGAQYADRQRGRRHRQIRRVEQELLLCPR